MPKRFGQPSDYMLLNTDLFKAVTTSPSYDLEHACDGK
jgi:hypothetical protein